MPPCSEGSATHPFDKSLSSDVGYSAGRKREADMSSGVFFVAPPGLQFLGRRPISPGRRTGQTRHKAHMCRYKTGKTEDK